MLPRPRIFVKKRGTRRTGTRWQGKVTEALLFSATIALGGLGMYGLIYRVVSAVDSGWWPWFAMLIPVALIAFGAIELIRLLWQNSASSERRAAVVQKATDWELPGVDARPGRPTLPTVPAIAAVTDSPGVRLAHRLPIDAASGWVSFTMAAVCLIWNSLVVMFVAHVIQLHRNGEPNMLLTYLMVPFVAAGVWTLGALGHQLLFGIAIGTTRVEVSQHPFYPGGTFHAFVSQTGRLRVRWYQVLLVCEEQAVYQQGTDTRRATQRVYSTTLFSQRKFEIHPSQSFDMTFDLAIPKTAMHSFVSGHNTIVWSLVVRGRMARWGDFERRFPVYVYPLRAADPAPLPYATAGAAHK